jgi:hypothetical protein
MEVRVMLKPCWILFFHVVVLGLYIPFIEVRTCFLRSLTVAVTLYGQNRHWETIVSELGAQNLL